MKKLNIDEVCLGLKNNGYYISDDFINDNESMQLQSEVKSFIKSIYCEENLKNRICYKREEGKNRQGDAIMVCGETSKLNSFVLPSTLTKDINSVYNQIITEMVGEEMESGSRSMLNCQQYFGESFEVGDHYDGEFFEYSHGEDKYGETTLKLEEGLVPRYVMVVVLYNHNESGTYVRMHDSKERINIPNKAKSLIIFDNVKMRHGVPRLEKERMMMGFRNFDYCPFHFQASPEGGNNWIELQDEINPGWIREISEEESIELQEDYLKKWKSNFHEYISKNPAF